VSLRHREWLWKDFILQTAKGTPIEYLVARQRCARGSIGLWQCIAGGSMVTELRIFTINKGRLDDFVRAWTAGVYPLRLKKGYRIDGAWVIKERNEFIWLLSYDGDDWEAKEKAYYASAERAAVNPDPAQYIAKIEKWFLTPVIPHGAPMT